MGSGAAFCICGTRGRLHKAYLTNRRLLGWVRTMGLAWMITGCALSGVDVIRRLLYEDSKGDQIERPEVSKKVIEKTVAWRKNDAWLIRHERNVERKGVVMSCPLGSSHTNRGGWKPRRMIRGVEAVVGQMALYGSSLPVYVGYYLSEALQMRTWCQRIGRRFFGKVKVSCFKIEEDYPVGLYGYAKIFAIRHAPLDEIIWFDCDIFPTRAPDSLFEDRDYYNTGTMFWPDSRDFFDENKVEEVLKTETGKEMFPKDAWWVAQGFDSGMMVMNRKRCAEEVRQMCKIARMQHQYERLRSLSMGDKDVFHIVWMLRGKNFTFVPYIGETGSIQQDCPPGTRGDRSKMQNYRHLARWTMSSQIKYGRNGKIYALHQLHRQPRYRKIATLASDKKFFPAKDVALTAYVRPLVVVRMDLRGGGGGDFVGEVERKLIGGEQEKRKRGGVDAMRGGSRLLSLAKNMSMAWGGDDVAMGQNEVKRKKNYRRMRNMRKRRTRVDV